MERRIVGFHCDTEGDWVAELDCGHDQHVRHRPPFQLRPWALEEEGRAAHLGTPMDCPPCDRTELPVGLRPAHRSAEWNARSLPAGLRRAHRLARGTWGRLVMVQGHLAFRARTNPPIDRSLEAGDGQPIPPGVEHEVEPDADARLFVEFFEVVPFAERAGTDPSSRHRVWVGEATGWDPDRRSPPVGRECGNVNGGRHPGGGAGGNLP